MTTEPAAELDPRFSDATAQPYCAQKKQLLPIYVMSTTTFMAQFQDQAAWQYAWAMTPHLEIVDLLPATDDGGK